MQGDVMSHTSKNRFKANKNLKMNLSKTSNERFQSDYMS